MPALVHAGKKLGSSGEIVKYVAKLPGGPALTSPDDDKFLKLCDDVAHEDLVNGYFLKTGNTGERAQRRTQSATRRKALRRATGAPSASHAPILRIRWRNPRPSGRICALRRRIAVSACF